MRTRAERTGPGRWRLNGTKMWITNGTCADVAVVWARTGEGIRGFLVEKGTPGFSAPEMHGKWSLRASVTSELVLEDVEVDEEAALLPEALGLKAALSCLTQARYGIAWGVLGAADACYQCALDYAKSRIQFDRPIASFQLQQEKLAWMVTELTKGQLLVLQLAALKERGVLTPAQVAHGQGQQRQRRPGDLPQGPDHPGRQRDPGRLPGHAPHGEPGKRLHLRRQPRHADAHRRRAGHRDCRLPLTGNGYNHKDPEAYPRALQ